MFIDKIYSGIKKRILPSEFDLEYRRWMQEDGESLRSKYVLNSESVIWDVGGYKGEFASDLYCRYSCNIKVFEPIPSFIKIIKEKFSNNKKLEVFPFGLGGEDTTLDFGFSDNATSAFISKNPIKAQIRDIFRVYEESGKGQIDLMKINIEGGEYQLLNRMIETGMISNVKNLQIQFHNFVPNAEALYSDLQQKLSKTHKKNWSYKFVWENWEQI